MIKWIKENKVMLITMLIFETVAILLFVSTKNLFYLLNFNYIGICVEVKIQCWLDIVFFPYLKEED